MRAVIRWPTATTDLRQLWVSPDTLVGARCHRPAPTRWILTDLARRSSPSSRRLVGILHGQ
jgi:hypothetical protein